MCGGQRILYPRSLCDFFFVKCSYVNMLASERARAHTRLKDIKKYKILILGMKSNKKNGKTVLFMYISTPDKNTSIKPTSIAPRQDTFTTESDREE